MRAFRKLWEAFTLLSLALTQTAVLVPAPALVAAVTASASVEEAEAAPPAIPALAIPNQQEALVIVSIGQSTMAGARNDISELPSGYCTTLDPKIFIWDSYSTKKIVQMVYGPQEQQPDPAYVDPAYTNTIGIGCEFVKRLRASGDTQPYYFFTMQMGGGSFTDDGSLGRTVNYSTDLSDGAWAHAQHEWSKFKHALAAQGKKPKVVLWRTDLGYGSTFSGTTASEYEAKMTGLIASLRATITGDAPLIIERLSSVPNMTNGSTIRTAQQNIEVADPRGVILVNTDGYVNEVDNIHPTAPTAMSQGAVVLNEYKGFWYPQKEWAYQGGCPVKREYRPGDLRNVNAGGTVSAAVDFSGSGATMVQATGANQPTLGTTTLASGLVARHATGDGVNDIMVSSTAFAVSDAGTWALIAVMSAPAAASTVLWNEGGAGVNPFMAIRSAASGAVELFYRDDAGTLTGPTSFGNGAFDGTMNFLAVLDNGSSVQSQVNGTLNTALSYTRGTTSTTQTGLFGLRYNGATETQYMNATIAAAILYDGCLPSTTDLANARDWALREFGAQ